MYALVRELPDGRFLAASVDFPHLLVEGNDASAALGTLTPRLSAQLRRLGTASASASASGDWAKPPAI